MILKQTSKSEINFRIPLQATLIKVEPSRASLISYLLHSSLNGENHRTVTNTLDSGAFGSNAILDLAVDDEVSLWVINDLSNDLISIF